MIPVQLSNVSFVFSWGKKRNNKENDDVLTHWILKPDTSFMDLEVSDQESDVQCWCILYLLPLDTTSCHVSKASVIQFWQVTADYVLPLFLLLFLSIQYK